MVLIDSSVWIDFFRGRETATTSVLQGLVRQGAAAVGDLILAEVLQGFDRDDLYTRALEGFTAVPVVAISDEDIALLAAAHHRWLRRRGVTIRKTIDTLIATRCIADGLVLLHNDRDFTPFAEHLGLQVHAAGASLH